MSSLLDQALAGTQPAPHSLPALPDPRGGFQTRTRLALLLRGDDSLWHERFVLGRLDKDSYACLTPDLEISQELLSFSNPEIKGIRVMRGSGGYLGVDPGELFSVDAAGTVLSDADIADWVHSGGRGTHPSDGQWQGGFRCLPAGRRVERRGREAVSSLMHCLQQASRTSEKFGWRPRLSVTPWLDRSSNLTATHAWCLAQTEPFTNYPEEHTFVRGDVC